MLTREINALGREITLVRGLQTVDVLADECQFFSTNDDQYYYDKLAIAGEGYVFTDKRRKKRYDKDLIPLDTDGQWIIRLLGKKRAEGKRLIVMDQEEDGKIILGPNRRSAKPKIKAGFFNYAGNFLEAADITGEKNQHPENFQTIMAIILRVHNLLYAIHKTCIREKDLPGRTFSRWELPRTTTVND
jgi:hypothetical protein